MYIEDEYRRSVQLLLVSSLCEYNNIGYQYTYVVLEQLEHQGMHLSSFDDNWNGFGLQIPLYKLDTCMGDHVAEKERKND